MNPRSKIANTVIILSILATLLVNCASGQSAGNAIVIAFAGTNYIDPTGKVNSRSEYAGVEMAVKEINALGGINGKRVKLVSYDDKKDVATAQTVAADIAQSNAMAVIGHSSAETSEAAANVYDEGKIPAINVVPGTDQLPRNHYYYYNAAFTVELQAVYLANYLRKVQGTNKVNIISGDDIYSRTLARQFGNTFRGVGGKIREFNAQGMSAGQVVNAIVSWNIDSANPEPIFIALPEPAASALVIAMRQSGINFPIVGANNLSSGGFIRAVAEKGEEQARPGYFTNDILVTRAIIFDSANEYALRFLKKFQELYKGEEPGDAPVIGYNAALATLEAIRRAGVSGKDIQADRENVINALNSIDESGNVIQGLTGPIMFDLEGNLMRSARFGVYANGNIISAMTQFQPIITPANLPNLNDLLQKGRVIPVGGNYVYRVSNVYTGIDIIDVRDINTQNSTYLMDFYLWFRYRPNPEDPAFKPDDYVFTNTPDSPTTVLISNVQPQEGDRNGVAYITYRITGTFKNDFDFRAYPFDYQNLIVRFRNQNADTTSIQYVVDRIGMRATRPDELKQHLQDNGAFRSLYGWRVTDAQAAQSSFATTSTMGNPQRFEQEDATRFSLFDITVLVRRIAIEYLIKSLLPLLLTLILAYISFYLPLGHSERFGVGSTALLTTAFFHLNLATTLPQIGYTVLMEFFFYVSYGLSVLIIILETSSIRLEKLGEGEASEEKKKTYQRTRERLNMIGRVVYPIILGGAFIFGGLTFNGKIVWPPLDKASLRTPASDIYDLATIATPEAATATQAKTSREQVVLKLATWRPEDTQEFEAILNDFREFALKEYNQDIRVEYAPVMSTSYDSILNIQLQRKNGPDLFFVRPFTVNSSISSYLLRLEAAPLVTTLESTYSAEKLQPWKNLWGTYYAVPFVGVVQGVYYNKTVFDKLNLSVPTTWEGFLSVAEALKMAGYIPIANGLNATEDSEMFMSIAANSIGGSEGRARFENGSLCFNGPQVMDAFKAIDAVLPYLPDGAANLNSKSSKQLFRDQRAAMLFGGSWDVKEFEQEKFEWSVFPIPAPKGQKTYVIFQPDIGVGINRDTPHQKEALAFINWLMDKRSAPTLASNLPGFYPLGNVESGTSPNTHDVEFLRLAADYPTDVRWIFTRISDHYPRASDIVRQALNEMAERKISAGSAANRLQNGLAEWYEPAQVCK